MDDKINKRKKLDKLAQHLMDVMTEEEYEDMYYDLMEYALHKYAKEIRYGMHIVRGNNAIKE